MRMWARRGYVLNLSRHRIGWWVVWLGAVLFFLLLMALFTARTAAYVL